MNNKKIILYQPWGGLGDNLQFSTIPELCNKNNIKFYLHKDNVYRNNEIKDLVWGLNPYISGETDESPNIGMNVNWDDNFSNFIEIVENCCGFKSENKYPKIYYTPKNIKELNDTTILSLNTISSHYDENYVFNIIKEITNNTDKILLMNFNEDINKKHKSYKINYNEYLVKNIYEHCDVIFSCKRYITLFSGSSVLSSAVNSISGKNNIDVILKKEFVNRVINEKYYYFENLNYVY